MRVKTYRRVGMRRHVLTDTQPFPLLLLPPKKVSDTSVVREKDEESSPSFPKGTSRKTGVVTLDDLKPDGASDTVHYVKSP